MSINIHYEIQLLAASLASGVWLMAAYDLIRIFRMAVHHGNLWTGLEDLCYWICSCFVTFSLLFSQNDGVLRGYAICGVLAGMIIFDCSIRRILFKLLKKCRKYLTIKRK